MKVSDMEATAMLIILLANGVCKSVDLPAVDGKPNTVIMCPVPATELPAFGAPPEKPAVKGNASGPSPIYDRRFSGGLG
jgi:hypothetical protein